MLLIYLLCNFVTGSLVPLHQRYFPGGKVREIAEERKHFCAITPLFLARYRQYTRLPHGNCAEFRELTANRVSATNPTMTTLCFHDECGYGGRAG